MSNNLRREPEIKNFKDFAKFIATVSFWWFTLGFAGTAIIYYLTT